MSSPVTVGLATRERAHELLDPICDLYDEVFSAPPFRWTDDESEHHRRMLASLLVEPTFGLVTAEADGQLVSFAYGYTLPTNTRWWDGFQEPLPVELTQKREGWTFALIDLAVHREWRGQGIGRQLVDVLLSVRSEQRATLCVQPSATDAQAFYDRLGWQKVGRKDMPADAVSPSFDVYVVELGNKP
jgi:ribosomal protein S18 acetylase RimI-like enzyme